MPSGSRGGGGAGGESPSPGKPRGRCRRTHRGRGEARASEQFPFHIETVSTPGDRHTNGTHPSGTGEGSRCELTGACAECSGSSAEVRSERGGGGALCKQRRRDAWGAQMACSGLALPCPVLGCPRAVERKEGRPWFNEQLLCSVCSARLERGKEPSLGIEESLDFHSAPTSSESSAHTWLPAWPPCL